LNAEAFFKENPKAAECLQEALPGAVITDISLMAEGSANRIYLVHAQQKRYVLRVPGQGVEEVVDRICEEEIYSLLKDYGIGDQLVYFNARDGYKLTEYLENSRHMDVSSQEDMRMFLREVRGLHELKLKCTVEYDFFKSIQKYEALRRLPSRFSDYAQVRERVFALRDFTEHNQNEYVMIHNDLSSENCLFVKDGDEEKCVLIDFEYAAMQNPMADIAYFCVFSGFSEEMVDHVIDCYFDFDVPTGKRSQVYAYIAYNGLIHSNWLEYRLSLGVDRRKEMEAAFEMARLYSKKAVEEMGG